MAEYTIKSINAQVTGNNVVIEIKGSFGSSKYVMDRVDVNHHNNGIELYVIAHFDENGPLIDVTEPFTRIITVTDLQPGTYYARVDNNNEWVKWFAI